MTRGTVCPPVHLVLVDDDVHDWLPWLEAAAREHLAKWKPLQRGFFDLRVHTCLSQKSFLSKVRSLLGNEEPVYAAVDLILPRSDGDEVPDSYAWKEVIRWCIERRVDAENGGAAFQFCVMSHDLEKLRELYSDAEQGEALQRHQVRKLDKAQITQSVDSKAKLMPLWEDLQSFILDQIESAVVPEGGAGRTEWSRLIWFGEDPRLCELRNRAERVAADPKGGLYLLFSDGSGYAEDWFHLVRYLRSDDPDRRYKVLNLATVRPFEDPDWHRSLREPPNDLLITGFDRFVVQGIDLGGVLEDSGLFDTIRSTDRRVFIQFPTVLSSGNAVKLSLDQEELAVLERCLDAVGVPTIEDLDRNLVHARNPRLLRFPRFSDLKAAGLTRRIIEHEVQQCQENLSLPGWDLDPELACVLAELPWRRRDGGFSALRDAIRAAYRIAARGSEGAGEDLTVGIELFPHDQVKAAYAGPVGLELRGRRLFDLLTARKPLLPAQESLGSARLHGLEELLELYTGLRRLVDLQKRLESEGISTTTESLSPHHIRALQKAHEFLDQILGGPEYLADRIERFRRVVEDPTLQHLEEEAYPSLKAREDWRELVERIQFVWPFDTFPLPVAVSDYLRHSAVVPEFTPDFPRILRRYPRLAAEWDEVEARRLELRQELQARENERWLAECYVREHDSQPVCVHLSDGVEPLHGQPHAFERAFRSFVLFNTHLAVCENRFAFDGRFLEEGQIEKTLHRVDLGSGLALLETYRKRLDHEAGSRTVFSTWHDRWPKASEQLDAVRLGRKLAKWLLSHRVIRESDDGSVQRIADLSAESEELPVADFLDMFRLVRNELIKGGPDLDFWKEEGEDAWDLFRRFVSASSRKDVRLAFIPDDGGSVVFWQRHKPRSAPSGLPGLLTVVAGSEAHPLFPIDDLVRADPETWSLWGAYSQGEDWLSLTRDSRTKLKPGPEVPWLPTQEAFRSSPLWSPASA